MTQSLSSEQKGPPQTKWKPLSPDYPQDEAGTQGLKEACLGIPDMLSDAREGVGRHAHLLPS